MIVISMLMMFAFFRVAVVYSKLVFFYVLDIFSKKNYLKDKFLKKLKTTFS